MRALKHRRLLGVVSRRGLLKITILAALGYLLYHHLPSPPPTANNDRADRPAPEHEVQLIPHFLHHSQFRQDPNLDYEAKLEDALRSIESNAPAAATDGIVKQLWQIQRTEDARGPDSIAFEEQNKDWAYTLVTDVWAQTFLAETLSAIPNLLAIYNSYPYNVLRADLLRYLLLWYYGGYYADTDVAPVVPITSCPPLSPLFDPDLRSRPDLPSLVLGIEIDEPYASPRLMHQWHWSRTYGFIQYTMFAPRRFSPILRRAIVRVLAHTRRHQAGVFTHGYDEEEILEVTGPGVFTDAVLDVLSEHLDPFHPLINHSIRAESSFLGPGSLPLSPPDGTTSTTTTQRRLTWAPFHTLREPLWIDENAAAAQGMGGLLVLPISVWGNGQRHSGAEGFNSSQACINHRFGRTWKKGWWEYLVG
ncbi:MAG: hypothetical protein M1819_003752 [Sarea resinae]|nr:MAG: hypothetical protein M1819_003752 [Sarea resinae]